MNFNGSYNLDANISKVWQNLNDPEILKNCIDGCSEFSTIENLKYKTKINVKLGPVNASFNSIIEISNVIELKSYEIEAKGNAGSLGYASGKAKIFLEEKENCTILTYEAESRINGKLAQLGSRLIEGSVKKNTEKFFKNFSITLLPVKEQISDEKKANNYKNLSLHSIFLIVILFILIFTMMFIYA